jgi:hypothetical protein
MAAVPDRCFRPTPEKASPWSSFTAIAGALIGGALHPRAWPGADAAGRQGRRPSEVEHGGAVRMRQGAAAGLIGRPLADKRTAGWITALAAAWIEQTDVREQGSWKRGSRNVDKNTRAAGMVPGV